MLIYPIMSLISPNMSLICKRQLTTTIQPNDYAVPVHSVKFGDVELLQFSNPNLKVPKPSTLNPEP